MNEKNAQRAQDDRVWCLEQLLRKEGFLDPRMYECAQECAISGRPEDKEALYTSWEKWKTTHPREYTQINRL